MKIRANRYQGLVDCVNVGEVQPSRIGHCFASFFYGGPHDKLRRFLDARTLVRDDDKPDIFLTGR